MNCLLSQFKGWRLTWILASLLMLSATARAGGVVTNCTEANLRAAMAGGGVVTFACDGTITLSHTITNTASTLLDAGGRQLTISGGDSVRVFYVQSNLTLAINHIRIAHGRSTNGAGLFNDHGTVNATNSTFDGNFALGAAGQTSPTGTDGGSGTGGAVASSGALCLVNCSFINNSAVGGAGGPDPDPGYGIGCAGGSGAGGAVWNSGLVIVSGCTFASNSSAGGLGGAGGSTYVGFPQRPKPDPGGPGGNGTGSALFNCGTARLVNSTFALNACAGGGGGTGGGGWPGYPYYVPNGPDGSPGLGFGAIDDASGQCYLTNCTEAFNSCGGIKTSGAMMVNTLLAENVPGSNCLGTIVDLGHNLSSDTSCAFTRVGSLNNTYALLGPLTNNGGPIKCAQRKKAGSLGEPRSRWSSWALGCCRFFSPC